MRHINLHLPCFFKRAVRTGSLPQRSRCFFELPTRLFSMILLDPVFTLPSVLHDSIKLVSAGSLSGFTMMSTNSSSKYQFSHRLPRNHCAEHRSRRPLSGDQKRQRSPFLFVAHDHAAQMDVWDLSLVFGCFAKVSPLDCVHQLWNERCAISCSISVLFAWSSRIVFSRGLPFSKLFLFFMLSLTSLVQHRPPPRPWSHASFLASFCLFWGSQPSRISSTFWFTLAASRRAFSQFVFGSSNLTLIVDLEPACASNSTTNTPFLLLFGFFRPILTVLDVRCLRSEHNDVSLIDYRTHGGQRSFDVSVQAASCCTSCRPERSPLWHLLPHESDFRLLPPTSPP